MLMKDDANNFAKDDNGDFPINTLQKIHEEMKNGIDIIYRKGQPEI